MFPLLAVTYPIISHIGVLLGYPRFAILWLGALFLASGLRATSTHTRLFSVITGSVAILLALSFDSVVNDAALRLPPIVITFGLAALFGATLLPGQTPLVSKIAERFRGTLPPSVSRYGRHLTAAWTALFAAMAIESVLLGLFASPFWWSLFTNFINYLIIAVFFVIEYPIRRRILSDVPHQPFFEYLVSIVRFGRLSG